ncbi:MAG: phosphoribosylpyrophosphate synthetase [Saprospiraceae bacterium]|nr:phosphoribosylpyrophosphate synthetase [Saprospiraceae bacterium]
MYSYDTLSQALNDLQKRGFTEDFNLLENCLSCKGNAYHPAQFNVLEVYRFEGMTNPDDSSVLYAIETEDGLKGTLVDAYGVYADSLSPEILEKLNIIGH